MKTPIDLTMPNVHVENSINGSPSWRRGFILIPLLLACFALAPTAQTAPKPSPTPQAWTATVGAQSTDQGQQALAFLPNEIWIHAGDSIRWTFDSNEIHTVTFLTEGQVRPPDLDGCSSSNPATFDGSTCVTSDPFAAGAGMGSSFTVNFPKAGNFKVVCLVHENMTGAIHVLDSKLPLPHDQAFYNAQTTKERKAVLSDSDSATNTDGHALIAGIGEVSATAGGSDTRSVLRFINAQTAMTDGKIQIHVGDTVQWSNQDPITPHTITFGTEPNDPGPPSANVTVDPDGVLHAVIKSPLDDVHSGVIIAAPQERTGLPQSPLGFTRFRVTFLKPGIFPYVCAFHDVLGMTGEVDVSP